MYEIYRETVISASHHLREYRGKCEAVHGHNWRIRVFAGAEELDGSGMVLDFVVLKRLMEEVCRRLDHADINTVPPFDTLSPTSENLARWVFDEMAARIPDPRVRITKVQVWETDTACAEYRR